MTETDVRVDRLMDPEAHASGEVHELWRWMRTHTPVHRHASSGVLPPFWSLTRYDDIRAAYRAPELYSSAQGVLLRPAGLGEDPGGGLTLALTDPPRHKELRTVVADRFSIRCARSLEGEIRARVRSVITDVIDRTECDFAHEVGARLTVYLICRLLGVPEQDHDQLLRWTVKAFDAGTPLLVHPQIVQYFVALMSARMSEPTDDAMSLLVTGRPSGAPLTDTEIVFNCENLVGAAENAGLSMTAGMLAFLEHPRQWRRLREQRALLPTAVEEVLRWTSSATHSLRTATRSIQVGGQRIEAGDRVVLWIPSANRDESQFPEPYEFDIARRPNRHLALGAGEHVCIGSTMARQLMRILYSELLDLTDDVVPSGPVVPLRSLAVSGPAHLPVRITPRRNRGVRHGIANGGTAS